VRARLFDRGAIFAGWVGLGMALVVAVTFALIIPVQTIVVLLALPMGVLIGVYANVRAERWRPRRRVLANSLYAGLVTGVAMAVMYVAIRFVFLYGDTGALPDGTSLTCALGPECTYARYVAVGQADELATLGITDGRTLEAAAWRELLTIGGVLVALTLAGSGLGAIARASSSQGRSVPLPTAAAKQRAT
jgi:hypothetical protein